MKRGHFLHIIKSYKSIWYGLNILDIFLYRAAVSRPSWFLGTILQSRDPGLDDGV